MNEINLIAAISLGLMGSFHCIGMCGPIALALPLPQGNAVEKTAYSLIYNLGRIITYALFGLLLGLFGKGLALAGLQQWLSIAIGVLMIMWLFMPRLFHKVKPFNTLQKKINILFSKKFRSFIENPTAGSLLVVGVLNGFLPCGLVYLALAGALATAGSLEGAVFMALFGAGTIPAMAFINVAGKNLGSGIRSGLRKAIPVLVFFMGVLFILRGMNLGIKYISPKINKQEQTIEHCCH